MPLKISTTTTTTMACDVPVEQAAVNPCCLVWKEKCSKLEKGRTNLKEAVKLLTGAADNLKLKNANLNKACEEERARTETEKQLREKELAKKVSLEHEISALKSEILSLQQKGRVADLKNKEGDVKVLQDRLSKGEKEINRLTELLKKEKLRADSEKKNAEALKKSVADAWKHAKAEKDKADAERKLANDEGKKAGEYRLQLEALKQELDEAKSKLVSANMKIEEMENRKLKAENHRVNEEVKNAESEAVKAEEQRNLSGANEKKFMEERLHAEFLSRQLEDAKQKIDELQMAEQCALQFQELKQEAEETKSKLVSMTSKFEEAKKKLEVEKSKVTEERNRADSEFVRAEEQRNLAEANENKFMEERLRAENFSSLLQASENKIRELEKEINKLKSGGATKLEVERQKANIEKRRADSEMLKAEEQRKLADANKMMADREKSRADKLSHQLEENRLKIEELQKLNQELLSFRKIVETSTLLPDRDVNARNTDVKLLEKQLKLEKMRLKHAKQVAKFEKSRSNILQKELHSLKLDFLQISCRLDVLDKCFSSDSDGIEGLKKAPSYADLQLSKLNRNRYGIEPCQMGLKRVNELLKPSCTAPLYPIFGGNYAESISGIDSKLESLLGGTNRKLLQSSAINSSSASFSDGQLVGSQERGSFVTTSENLVEENFNAQPTISSMSDELTEKLHNQNFALVAEHSIKSPRKVDAVGMVNGHGKKRRMLEEIENIEFLYSEGKMLQLKMEEKLCVLRGVLNGQVDELLDDPKYVDSNMEGGRHSKPDEFHRKRKKNHEESVLMQHSSDINEPAKINKLGNAFFDPANVSKLASPSMNYLIETTPLECREDSVGSGFEDMACFEEVADGDYMKLLDLDDAADEELYRRAVLMPMSPSLPEIEDSSAETFNMDKLESLNRMDIAKASDIQCVNDGVDLEMPIIPLRDGSLKFPVESELRLVEDKIPLYCVIFSNINDSKGVSRVFSATRNCTARCSFGGRAESMVQEILRALEMEKDLSPREKASTFLTLLLLNFSACTWGKVGTSLNEDLFSCLDSFARDINTVVSDIEARSLFAEECCLDELLALVEEFLIDGRLMVLTVVSSDTIPEHDSRISILLDSNRTYLSWKSSSVELLLASSIILGSLCAAIDRLGFLCEASYNLLRIRRFDTAIILPILHIFAYLGGEKFFSLKDYSLTVAVLKSLVKFLEEGNSSDASVSSCLPSTNKVMSAFHPCTKCIFSRDAVPIAVVTSLLLEKLQNFSVSETMQSAKLSKLKDKTNRCLREEEVHSDVGICCNASCSLNKCVMPATKSISIINGTLSDLSDVLSLVELLACNMSWEWTSGKIIPFLLDILDRANAENFVITVLILLGQLGRIGVATCGYEDKGVDTLRRKFSSYLSGETAVIEAFPVQIASVSALLGILSLDFEKVISGSLELPTSESQSVFTDCIRNWFSLLSKERQALSFSLLKSGVKV